MSPQPRLSRFACLVSLVAVAPMFVACGRPATEEECLAILRKSAKFELESRLEKDQELIRRELVEIETQMKPTMMKKCVGKRISDERMRCVERAKSSEELFEECLQ
jgi:hypothetical protein